MTSDLTLALFFEEDLQVAHGKNLVSFEQTMKGKDYAPTGSDWFGFYDWLRVDDSVVGLRVTPLTPEPILQSLRELSYVHLGEHDELEVFFTNLKNFAADKSCDQSFGYNQLWISSNCPIAFAVSLDDCSDEDRAQILRFSNASLGF